MIKFLLGVVVILAIIGGAVKPINNDLLFGIAIDKETVMSSIQNGAVTVYDFVAELIKDSDTIESVDLITPEK